MESITPLFPVTSLPSLLEFYRALGFEVTFEQHEPYPYASIQYGAIEVNFSLLSVYGAKNAMGACIVYVDDVAKVHRDYSDGLRQHYGTIPTADSPRITRFKEGDFRFRLFDPSGNMLVYIDRDHPDSEGGWFEGTSPLIAALNNAVFLRDTYCKDDAAAKVLEKALAQEEPSGTPIERALVLAALAELYIAMEQPDRADEFRAQLRQIELSDADRERYQQQLTAADTLERWLTQKP